MLVIGSVVVTLGFVEGTVRLIDKYRPDKILQKTSADYYLHKMMKDPALLRDYYSGPCKPVYRDYYYMSFRCKSEKLNTTDYFDARKTPGSTPLGKTQNIVWLFGGSTMLNLTAPDELTIANQVAVHVARVGVSVTVQNFGMAGFASTQELVKFIDLLRRTPKAEHPKVVIFYDGYNDSGQSYTFGPGNLQEDLSAKFRFLVEDQQNLLPSIGSDFVQGYSVVWSKFVSPMVQNWYLKKLVSQRPSVSQNPDAAVDLYAWNVKLIRAVCKEFGIRPLFVLQPMIFTKHPLSEMEREVMKWVVEPNKPHLDYMQQWYAIVQSRMANAPDFLDLTRVLDHRIFDDFADHGHTAPETGIVIAASLADRVRRELFAR